MRPTTRIYRSIQIASASQAADQSHVPSSIAGDGEVVSVAPCKGGGAVPQQQWEFDSAARLRAVGTQSCADAGGAVDGDAVKVPIMRPCGGAASQRIRTPPAAAQAGKDFASSHNCVFIQIACICMSQYMMLHSGWWFLRCASV